MKHSVLIFCRIIIYIFYTYTFTVIYLVFYILSNNIDQKFKFINSKFIISYQYTNILFKFYKIKIVKNSIFIKIVALFFII